MLDLNKKPIGKMIQCPNCKQDTLPFSFEAGLLTDWCDACDTSIFDEHYESNNPTPSDFSSEELPF